MFNALALCDPVCEIDRDIKGFAHWRRAVEEISRKGEQCVRTTQAHDCMHQYSASVGHQKYHDVGVTFVILRSERLHHPLK